LLGLLAVLVRSDLSKDAELLVPRHENQVLRRQLNGRRLRWDHASRIWLTALSRLVNRRPVAGSLPGYPGHYPAVAPEPRRPQMGLQQQAPAGTTIHWHLGQDADHPDGQGEPGPRQQELCRAADYAE
jgi:hypothetical protein